ncbi:MULTISPECIES: diaminopimelate decarboxylase [Alteribacter]|uniref:Diaminopimelate decarboxylase n=1 Tax=Alteribacter keqinensis TaxID=2483800 RepID=A0A3M7TUY3_9BACI|nr:MULTISPECIES: diaminopimelate decarboxylase [Alteribacter]MBM7094733.1 diaminopimelate decarboxylase [Alteribacter salitolerans]RNA69071.1 diaminopimelate decarboxylase [Alteribacter keqinensis]
MTTRNHDVNSKGNLTINGVDTTYLAEKYGTPLYVYDVEDICIRANAFKEAFEKEGIQYQVAYASKAFSCVAIVQLMDELGLSLDVVSGGELYTALEAGFPPERIHFHGNNKSPDEIEMAVKAGIGCFVVDNFHELTWLTGITQTLETSMKVLLRITPGVEAHTHEYISTGQEDSKFGFDITSGQAEKAIAQVLDEDRLELLGVHCHIGSQIFETSGFVSAVDEIFNHLQEWRENTGFTPEVVNLGGGFGIRYNEDDTPLPLGHYVEAMVRSVKEHAEAKDFPIPEIWIEPGRALVGEAGTTLYTVGSRKSIPGVRDYVSVDGGMTDNLRPALYQAKYDAIVANKAQKEKTETVSIAGKCCESGDMLIWDVDTPVLEQGDILAVPSTGAYGYSMANNYNRIQRPAVVFLNNKSDQCVIERETYANMTRLDRPWKKTEAKTKVYS